MRTSTLLILLSILVLAQATSIQKAKTVAARRNQLKNKALASLRAHLLGEQRNPPENAAAEPAHDKSHFTYKCVEGDAAHNEQHRCPTHWNLVEVPDPKGTNGALLPNQCASTERQSPIDLPAFASVTAVTTNQLITSYAAFPLKGAKVFNNGHTVQVNLPKENTCHLKLKIGDVEHKYKLLQFHFHAPSEHKIAGQGSCMEMHLVHSIETAVDGVDELLAVGIMFQSHGEPNANLAKLFEKIPAAPVAPEKETVAVIEGGDFDINALLTGAGLTVDKFYHYKGSLTTPPCSEKVDWYVLDGKAKLGTAQLEAFKNALPEHENARPLQNSNNKSTVEKRG